MIRESTTGVVTIQYLRGIAALMVVFAHANEQFMTGFHRIWRNIGWSGVDLFFVISGFVMTYTAATHNYTRREFLLRRVARIVPMYWFMTLCTAALCLAVPHIFLTTHFGWSYLLQSLAFFPAHDPITRQVEPLLHLGWTLNYEMFFYVCFAACLYASALARVAWLTAMFAGLMVLATIIPITPLVYWGRLLVFEFLFGCLIATALMRGLLRAHSRTLTNGVLAVSLVLLVAGSILDERLGMRWLYRGVPAALVVMAVVAIEQLREVPRNHLTRWMQHAGDASYSIYLTHILLVMGMRRLWLSVELPTKGAAVYGFVALCVTGAALCGMVAYRRIESPLSRSARLLLRI